MNVVCPSSETTRPGQVKRRYHACLKARHKDNLNGVRTFVPTACHSGRGLNNLELLKIVASKYDSGRPWRAAMLVCLTVHVR